MKADTQDRMRREMDEALLAFRVARKEKRCEQGWVRAIRQAIGVPVDEFARRLGVCKWEVFRLEQSEQKSRIMLATLRKAAAGLGCELVYALVPQNGTLEDLANAQREAEKNAAEAKLEAKKNALARVGWRAAMFKALRTVMRREGVRVR